MKENKCMKETIENFQFKSWKCLIYSKLLIGQKNENLTFKYLTCIFIVLNVQSLQKITKTKHELDEKTNFHSHCIDCGLKEFETINEKDVSDLLKVKTILRCFSIWWSRFMGFW